MQSPKKKLELRQMSDRRLRSSPSAGSSFVIWVLAPICFLALASFSQIVVAQNQLQKEQGFLNETPPELKGIEIDQNLGAHIDLDAPFYDETGKVVRLRDYTVNGKPILLSLAYYNCPSLCNIHLNGLKDAFKQMSKPVGEDFNFVVISFEPKEKPELAAAKLKSYLKSYNRPEGNKGWHFLTGASESIEPLAKAVGFKYRWDEEQKQYAHASAAYAISPDGVISRYFYGISFDPKTIRLSMIEASQGMVGNIVDKLVLYCFHYDAKGGRYTVAAYNIMRAGGVLILLVVGSFMLPFWLRIRRESRSKSNGNGPQA